MRSEEIRLRYVASQSHHASLDVGGADADPSPVEVICRSQFRDQLTTRFAEIFHLVHKVDFVLVEFAVAGDLSVLVFHLYFPVMKSHILPHVDQ